MHRNMTEGSSMTGLIVREKKILTVTKQKISSTTQIPESSVLNSHQV